MKISEFIKAMLAAGHTKEEIDKALETNNVMTADLAAEIKESAIANVKADLAAKKFDSLEKALNGLTEKLASVAINPAGAEFGPATKRFDPITKTIVTLDKSEAKKTQQVFNLAMAIAKQDHASANAIQEEILKERNLATQRSDSTTVGGYLVPDETEMTTIQNIYTQSQFLQNTSGKVIDHNGRIYPIMYGGSVTAITNQDTNLTESNVTLTTSTLAKHRVGAYTKIANELIEQRVDFVPQLMAAAAGWMAYYSDLILPCGSVSGNSDKTNGLFLQTNTKKLTPVAMADWNFAQFELMLQALNANAKNVVLMGNLKMFMKTGNWKEDNGDPIFPGYKAGGAVTPMGKKWVLNTAIPSTFTTGFAARTTGTSDGVALYDPEYVYTILNGITMALSEHYAFIGDQTVFRVVGKAAVHVAVGESDAGVFSVAQEVTN